MLPRCKFSWNIQAQSQKQEFRLQKVRERLMQLEVAHSLDIMKSQESQNIRITDNRGHGMLLIPWKVRVSRCTLREMQWVNTVSPNISRKLATLTQVFNVNLLGAHRESESSHSGLETQAKGKRLGLVRPPWRKPSGGEIGLVVGGRCPAIFDSGAPALTL